MSEKIDEVELLDTAESHFGQVLMLRVLKSTEPMRAGLVFKVVLTRPEHKPTCRARDSWEAHKHAPILRCIWRAAVNRSARKNGETFEWPEFFEGIWQ